MWAQSISSYEKHAFVHTEVLSVSCRAVYPSYSHVFCSVCSVDTNCTSEFLKFVWSVLFLLCAHIFFVLWARTSYFRKRGGHSAFTPRIERHKRSLDVGGSMNGLGSFGQSSMRRLLPEDLQALFRRTMRQLIPNPRVGRTDAFVPRSVSRLHTESWLISICTHRIESRNTFLGMRMMHH